ncbi:hypothetical protein HW555_010579 [Spodoptera exigua]|uniref:Gustatory receptor n=1 Tax=Spodoptera exigua TaxID=7107 RepID=A0A835G6V8_SPOEX|nr:hypothetical protein HW555_010579 [Spodoptera exigua]
MLRCISPVYRWGISIGTAPHIMLLSSDTSRFLVYFFLFTLHSRLVLIEKCLKNNSNCPANSIGVCLGDNVKMVRKCLRYYNNLLDNMLIVDRPLQILLSIEVVCGIPRWIEGMYFISCDLMTGATTNSVFFNTFEITFNIILVTSPAFVVELIANKTDEIKAILMQQIIYCSDPSFRFELETALQYVQRRPFNLAICRIIPVNANLPFIILNICVVYVFITMQFAHYTKY